MTLVTQAPARRYSGQSPDERDASRLARLMASAKELIGSQGYAATTVERVCAEAKVSTRNFYQYFENKEAIFLAVYDDITSRSFERATASLAETEGEPIVARIPRAFLAYVGPMIEDMQAAHIVFVEIVGASRRIEERRLSYREALIELVSAEGSAAVAKGEIADRNFRVATLALTGAANAIVYDWTLHEDRCPVQELETELAALAVTLLAG
jgi:AcrR family transcriptional regulator